MANNIIIHDISDHRISIAERKGIGHPDTICDEITEQISIELCKYYLSEFGMVMHHNVDKALLIGGQSQTAFNGGKMLKPISLIIAGRATSEVEGRSIPVNEIAVETARNWLKDHITHLDVIKDVSITSEIRPGSSELVELFSRFGRGETPLANDTSFGAGFYPLSKMENTILEIDRLLCMESTKLKYNFMGEDTKVMGVEIGEKNYFTVAIAMVDKYIRNVDDYKWKINEVQEIILRALNSSEVVININTADDYEKESLYLTVTGTSAEHGDDGQVGRGNRINGLITPYHPMSLEAASGKNPVSHIGKIYNYFTMDLSRAIVENNFAEHACTYIVSQIGKPIDQPQLLHLKLRDKNTNDKNIEDLAKSWLDKLSEYWKRIINL